MAFCRNCGAQNADNASFCGNCGASLGQNIYGHNGGTVIMVKPKIPGRGLGISSMVLGIIGLVYSVMFLFSIPQAIENLEYISFREPDYSSFLTPVAIFSVLSILSICFAPAAFKRGYKNGVSTSGLVMGTIGLVGYFITLLSVLSYM